MLTLKEALFSRKNMKRYTISDLKDIYGLIVLEYITNSKYTAFMIIDNLYNKSNAIVIGKVNGTWYVTGKEHIGIDRMLRLIDDNTSPITLYCVDVSNTKKFNDLDKLLKHNHGRPYEPNKLRYEIETIIKPYIKLFPDEVEFK